MGYTMINSPTDTQHTATDSNSDLSLVFYKFGNTFSSDLIDHIKQDTSHNIEMYDDWCPLVTRLSTLARPRPGLIVLGLPALKEEHITLHETINMIMTLCRHTSHNPQMKLAAGAETQCDTSFVKELQHSEISGIIPSLPGVAYDKIIYAIRELVNGRTHWAKSVTDIVSQTDDTNTHHIASGSYVHLTPRQEQVQSLLCNRGLSNKKIASVLHISESTVKIHISAILKAVGVRNRTQLVLAVHNSLHH